MNEEYDELYLTGESELPYLLLESDLDDDQYTNVLCQLLQLNSPELLNRFRYVVVESTQQWKKNKDQLKALEEERTKIVGKAEADRAFVENALRELPEEPKLDAIELGLTVGLSVFPFLSIASLSVPNTNEILAPKNLPNAVVSLLAAISINLAERKTIESHAEYAFEMKQSHKDADNLDNSFWDMVVNKESTIWLAGTIVAAETTFVASGLLEFFPNAEWPQRFAIIIGSSLSALINVSLAWGSALKRASWRRKYLEDKQKIVRAQLSRDESAKLTAALLNDMNDRIQRLREETSTAKLNATKEYRRWERDVKNYLLVRPFGPSDLTE